MTPVDHPTRDEILAAVCSAAHAQTCPLANQVGCDSPHGHCAYPDECAKPPGHEAIADAILALFAPFKPVAPGAMRPVEAIAGDIVSYYRVDGVLSGPANDLEKDIAAALQAERADRATLLAEVRALRDGMELLTTTLTGDMVEAVRMYGGDSRGLLIAWSAARATLARTTDGGGR